MGVSDKKSGLAQAMHDVASIRGQMDIDLRHLKDIGFEQTFTAMHRGSETYGRRVHVILSDWEANPSIAPSMPAIMTAAANAWGLDTKSEQFQRTLKAGELGHTPAAESAEFHAAPAHPRKVLLQMIRLISTHNDLTSPEPHLTSSEINLLMTAAAIHDLKHDGKNNGSADNHIQFRLENMSFAEFDKTIGDQFSQQEKELLHLMLRCTDPSSKEGPLTEKSPLVMMKRFATGKISVDDLPKELKGLSNPRHLFLCRMLSTADLATSAGLCKERTLIESAMLAKETGVPDIAKPEVSAGFIPKAELTMLAAGSVTYFLNPKLIVSQLSGQSVKSLPKPTNQP